MTRFKIRKRNSTSTTRIDSRICRGTHQFVIRTNEFNGEHKLECRNCNKFYGYIKDPKSYGMFAEIMKSNGYVDIDNVRYAVTDYTNKSDNNRRKKEPKYDPKTDDTQCRECGKHFIGDTCFCGWRRTVRRIKPKKMARIKPAPFKKGRKR